MTTKKNEDGAISARDLLRSGTLGKKRNIRKEIVTVDGKEFEVRSPTVGERQSIQDASTKMNMVSQEVEVDAGEMSLQCLLLLTYVPGTDDKVFEPADVDSIKSADGYTDGWVEVLSAHAMSMITGKAPAGN